MHFTNSFFFRRNAMLYSTESCEVIFLTLTDPPNDNIKCGLTSSFALSAFSKYLNSLGFTSSFIVNPFAGDELALALRQLKLTISFTLFLVDWQLRTPAHDVPYII